MAIVLLKVYKNFVTRPTLKATRIKIPVPKSLQQKAISHSFLV